MSAAQHAIPERIRRHVAAFNEAVRTHRYEALAARFTDEARMSFAGLPIGPFAGRDAILGAYRASPPDDTMDIASATSDGQTDRVRFRWSRGGTGTMTLHWHGELVESLEVEFDE